MAMSGNRCILKCDGSSPLYLLPMDDESKSRWLRFVFNTVPQQYSAGLCLCSRHFAEDCFLSRPKAAAGSSKRFLKYGSIPTLCGPTQPISPMLPATVLFHDAGNQSQCYILQQITVAENVAVPSVAVNSTHSVPAIKHVACQTDPPERKSAGTQLSLRTLQNRIRSRATQTTVASKDCGVCTLTFPLDSPMLFLQPTIVRRPSKRPRLSLTDEEDGPSECSSSIVVHEPKDST